MMNIHSPGGIGLNAFFILCIVFAIVIIIVPNILEYIIAIFLLILGISGLVSGFAKRRRPF
ncbi:DUF3096 domain-containing protein [archaeon]|nr:DUF3096 domain-containing protein [archaeon]MBL7057635.1 DUF3096 domain-containing protein [Candidatus Woesearchaeota archaeon]